MLSKLKLILNQLDALQLFAAATCAALISSLVASAAIDAGLLKSAAQICGVLLWMILFVAGGANFVKIRGA